MLINNFVKTAALACGLCLAAATTTMAQAPGKHPSYLHALSDLRAARWMIQHRPGNWLQTDFEMTAINQIDAAINDIKKASIFDGKNIDDHPQVDERNDHIGRLHEAHDFLKKARQDVNQEEDDPFTQGLKGRSIKHISAALHAVDNAIHT